MADEGPQEITVDQLLANQPYNPEIIPDLEAHVEHQVKTGSYNLDANLALLRLYQFEPSKLKIKVVSQILIKAIMVLPRVDPNLCLGLISEAVQSEEPVAALANLVNVLECAHFSQLWTDVGRMQDLLGSVPGFEDAIRSYAVQVLGLAYSKVPRHVLAEAVNINGPSLDDFIQSGVRSKGWFVSKTKNGEVIELGTPGAEPVLHKGVADSIPLEHVARLFPMLA